MGEDALGPLITSLQTGSDHVYSTLGHDGAFSPALSSASTFTEKQLNHYVQAVIVLQLDLRSSCLCSPSSFDFLSKNF